MSFRLRLMVFIVATLATIQIITAVLVYNSTRNASIASGRKTLSIAAEAFVQQLDDVSDRVSSTVQVLSLDFALRSAIAQRDRQTVLSALRNHGRRIGAVRMMLIDLDGTIEADTADAIESGGHFAFQDLSESALKGPASAVVTTDGRANWTVVVPVFAPALTGLIAASISIDDALLARMQRQSAMTQVVELATPDANGLWHIVASGGRAVGLTPKLDMNILAGDRESSLIEVAGREYLVMVVHLSNSQGSAPVVAVIGYSLDDALAPFRSLGLAWASLLGLGLGAGLIGAMLIARGVSRPIETLASSARRIAAGDYSLRKSSVRTDEIGDLATAFSTMATAIGEREDRIRYQAAHDAVTGLPNSSNAETVIQTRLNAEADRPGALLTITLARLPDIVRTVGHTIADRVMRDAAQRLIQHLPSTFLARVTDGEFALWLPGAEHAEATAAAIDVLGVLSKPFQESDLTVDLSPAVGIALSPLHGTQASMLMQHAGVASFAAVARDDRFACYDPATDPHRPERLSLMTDLREAIEQDRLQLHYQPKLNLALGIIDAVEGLVRWQHPRLGAVAPDAFIGLAEETGNIRRLTRWVLATGIEQAGRWRDKGLSLRLALNLSVRDLDDQELPQFVESLLLEHGLAADRIVFEVTESAVMDKPEAAVGVLSRIAALGIGLAIDDFGVGQSSFSYLRRLPVSELKIDKAFVLNLGSDRENQAIVQSIVELGHRLGHGVTAEGVEDQAALDYLAGVGCDHAQGYLISRAMVAVGVETFLADRRWTHQVAETGS
jgi:diguanylate cyclase (GGDEF)-like protein